MTPRRLAAALCAVVAAVLVAWEPWYGTILIVVTPDHGLDTGDLPAVGLVAAALTLLRPEPLLPRCAPGWAVLVPFGATLGLVGALGMQAAEQARGPLVEAVAPCLLGLATTWLAVCYVRSHSISITLPVVILMGGLLVDTVFTPSGTVFGPAALVGWFAATAPRRILAVGGWSLAAACLVANVASLADVAGIDVAFSRSQGGAVRAVALGIVLTWTGSAGWIASGPRSVAERATR